MAGHLSLIYSARPSRRGAPFHYHLLPFLSSRLNSSKIHCSILQDALLVACTYCLKSLFV
ncbi:hypothetical protein NC651_005742 [Populus alba x Populus x berolinensis]|nr:hypothetical protein NC651_005742 [Populus alba x Populus x berolinensis]